MKGVYLARGGRGRGHVGFLEDVTWGPLKPRAVCPHCQTGGQVRMKPMKVKNGISGAKAAGAVLTGGLSTVATSPSRTAKVTQARCGACGTMWRID